VRLTIPGEARDDIQVCRDIDARNDGDTSPSATGAVADRTSVVMDEAEAGDRSQLEQVAELDIASNERRCTEPVEMAIGARLRDIGTLDKPHGMVVGNLV
jgi:hypothetical protein